MAEDSTVGPVSAVMACMAYMANAMALDPPDFNYKTVEPPQALSLPSSGNTTVDHVVNDYLTAISLEAASLHAIERWEGASIAGVTASETLQLNAYNTYSAEAAKAEAVLSKDNDTLISVLPPVPVSAFPGGATAMAAAFDALCGRPLPSSLNASLLSLGLSQSEIDQRVCDIVSVITPSDINTNFAAVLSKPLP